ncbi:MAG: hypothetical protein NXY57DRAFT_1030771 [Lentinula lateritia]|uniref:Uncharacterized protein n=1 Tax=Lentinula lateritia TaxID=40482 RepID=A0ABQ8VA50_9AGAR|nr:MAG: hypothetical protein NXY57DRAFT_1030771 [Lentinula lateritia]KAJ4483998.1 hypothetical protein C8R41DRAFT_896564 [Lentinula lateritia]
MTNPRPPSLRSTPSAKAVSTLSAGHKLPPISTVTTVPPWAKDEPPSPKEETSTSEPQLLPHSTFSNDVASVLSSEYGKHSREGSSSLSRWFAFTMPRQAGRPFQNQNGDDTPARELHRKASTFKDKRRSWLANSNIREPPPSFSKHTIEKNASDPERNGEAQPKRRDWNLSISMPTPRATFTVNQTNSPGWETPWTSRVGAQGPFRSRSRHEEGPGYEDEENLESHSGLSGSNDDSRWESRRKRLRIFLLSNPYVPLLFRLVNISFTTGTLAVAIHIRNWEKRYGLMGIVGSSPTLIIIFAPLTLVHVIGAIYLEYFGRPLGLWRTSAKLAHTLSEVLFICAWSAALSLCFDNFFTSLIPCASHSTISWYNSLPRPNYNLPTVEGSVGDALCDSQLALICLVFVSLVMYCTNLVISLYRIFEKVKYLPGTTVGFRNR